MKYSDAAYSGGPMNIMTYWAIYKLTLEGLDAESARVMNPAIQTSEAQVVMRRKCVHL